MGPPNWRPGRSEHKWRDLPGDQRIPKKGETGITKGKASPFLGDAGLS